MRRAAGPTLPGKTGCGSMRPSLRNSCHLDFGKLKCAAWSPWRWPISRRPTLNASSPSSPSSTSTPGHPATSAVIRSLKDCWALMGTPRNLMDCAAPSTVQVKVHLKSRGFRRILVVVTAPPELLSIGAMSERTGVSTSALRFYEAEGLIHSVRSSGGQRRYPRDVIRRVSFVRIAQEVGLSLAEIRAALASLPDNRTPTQRDWHRLSTSWRPRLDAQIAMLERLRDRLEGCIGC